MTEIARIASRIAEAISIPILADIDTGFGGVLNVGRTIREMERAGVAGVHIEDQALPKHCPMLVGRDVVSRGEAIDRIKAALDARTDPDLVVVARTDADIVSISEVVERCNLYLEAGVDLVMPVTSVVDGKSYFDLSPDDQMALLAELPKRIEGPVMHMGSGPPKGYTNADLAKAGYALTMSVMSAVGAAANAMAAIYREIMTTGTDAGYIEARPGPFFDPVALMKAARLDEFVDLEKRYGHSL